MLSGLREQTRGVNQVSRERARVSRELSVSREHALVSMLSVSREQSGKGLKVAELQPGMKFSYRVGKHTCQNIADLEALNDEDCLRLWVEEPQAICLRLWKIA
jgi:putative hemolysin